MPCVCSFFFQFLVLLGASGAQSCLLTLALSHTMCTIGYYAIRMFGHLTLVTLPFDLFDLVFINFVQWIKLATMPHRTQYPDPSQLSVCYCIWGRRKVATMPHHKIKMSCHDFCFYALFCTQAGGYDSDQSGPRSRVIVSCFKKIAINAYPLKKWTQHI